VPWVPRGSAVGLGAPLPLAGATQPPYHRDRHEQKGAMSLQECTPATPLTYI